MDSPWEPPIVYAESVVSNRIRKKAKKHPALFF